MSRLKESGSEILSEHFEFPCDRHLVITTENQVLCWDAHGVTTTFRPESGGILAAKESKDGKNRLAIADSQIVLLHDCQRRFSNEHRLKGADDEVRLLEFSQDSKCLFFTTSLQSAPQRYSIDESRILDPAHAHPSPPTVLAISPTSHLLLTASTNPPIVYLQNLTYGTSPLLLSPTASTSTVSVAAFHPERPNIFLLGFSDGTIAAYDATAVLRDRSSGQSAEIAKSGGTGEISHLKGLHRVLTRSEAKKNKTRGGRDSEDQDTHSRTESITAAAFMPGCGTRAVSVGADGKCRLIDFRGGVTILRTWKMRAPATSLSISALKPASQTHDGFRHRGSSALNRKQSCAEASKSAADAKSMLTDNIIAIGRVDSKVALFDSIGSLLIERDVDPQAGRVIGIEWIEGPSPRPVQELCDEQGILKPSNGRLEIDEIPLIESEYRSLQRKRSQTGLKRKRSKVIHSFDCSIAAGEMESSVKRRSQRLVVSNGNSKPADYMDLFSPVKCQSQSNSQSNSVSCGLNSEDVIGRTSIALVRDRSESGQFDPPSPSRKPSNLTPTNDILNIPESPKPPPQKEETIERDQSNAAWRSPMSTAKSFRRMPGSFADDASSMNSSRSMYSKSSGKTSGHSTVLADLKRIGSQDSNNRNGIALFAPYIEPLLKPAVSRGKTQRKDYGESHLQGRAEWNPSGAVETESSSKRSYQTNNSNADIWLDSSSPEKPSRSCRRPPLAQVAHSQTASTSHSISQAMQRSDPHLNGPNKTHLHPAAKESTVNGLDFPTHPVARAHVSSIHTQPSVFSFTSSDSHAFSSHAASLDSLNSTHNRSVSDNSADFGLALHREEAIESDPPLSRTMSVGGSPSAKSPTISAKQDGSGSRRCSCKQVVELLSPKRRRERVGEGKRAKESEEGKEVENVEKRKDMKDKLQKGQEKKALQDLAPNEVAGRLDSGKPVLQNSDEETYLKRGKMMRLGANKSRAKPKLEKSKGQVLEIWQDDVQPKHTCHCTECPELRRELKELRDQMAQLKQEMLALKKDG